MFQSANGLTIQFPELSAIYQNIENERRIQNGIDELIKEQYIQVLHLGIDYLEDTEIDTIILRDLITYYDVEYSSIANIEIILQNDVYVNAFGRFIYSFLAVDLLKSILPKIITLNKYPNINSLINLSEIEWRSQLAQAIQFKLNTLRDIIKQAPNDVIQLEMFKYTYYIDLIDSDLSGLLEKFILPMISIYDVYLNSTTP